MTCKSFVWVTLSTLIICFISWLPRCGEAAEFGRKYLCVFGDTLADQTAVLLHISLCLHKHKYSDTDCVSSASSWASSRVLVSIKWRSQRSEKSQFGHKTRLLPPATSEWAYWSGWAELIGSMDTGRCCYPSAPRGYQFLLQHLFCTQFDAIQPRFCSWWAPCIDLCTCSLIIKSVGSVLTACVAVKTKKRVKCNAGRLQDF